MPIRSQKKTLTGYKRDVLKLLGRLQYSVVHQISYWSDGRHISRSYDALNSLESLGYIKKHTAMKPYIFSLTREGFRISGTKLPNGSRIESWSVMTHRCHRNEVEIRMRENFDNFLFLSRTEMYKKGVNPGFGEHLGVAENRSFLVLLDDYYMESTRISHAYKRPHKPNKYHFDVTITENVVPRWSDIITDYVVSASDDDQYQLHKNYISIYNKKYKNNLNIMLLKIEALW